MAVAAKFGAVMRDPEPGVIERGARPDRRRMTGFAGRREPGRDVIRTRGGQIHRLVTIVTKGGGQFVIAAHVTQSAGSGRVGAGQRKARLAVVEGGAQPIRGGVAGITGRRETGRRVIGIGCGVVRREMAVDASRTRQAEIVVDMALRALQAGVGTRECETGCRVVKSSAQPIRGGVAETAILREAGCFVRGIGRAVVLSCVAVEAGRAG